MKPIKYTKRLKVLQREIQTGVQPKLPSFVYISEAPADPTIFFTEFDGQTWILPKGMVEAIYEKSIGARLIDNG